MAEIDAAPADAGSAPDPVDLISGLLEREDNPQPKPARDQAGKFTSQQPDPQPEPEETPEPEAEPGPEVPPEEGEDEDDDGQDPQEPPPEEPELYEVKIGDKVEKVTREELVRGYQRQSDYSRRMNELAESRRQAETVQQSIAAERQHYVQQLDQLATVLQTALPPRPTDDMLASDPIGYLQAEKAWEARVGQLRQVLAERDRAQQLSQQQQESMQREMLQRAKEQLVEILPEWKKPEIARKEQPLIARHLREVGYTDQEIGQAADPRAIILARESMLYRQLMANRSTVQQRVQAAPKMVRPGSSGPAPDKSKQIVQQIRRSGGKDLDAVAALIDLG